MTKTKHLTLNAKKKQDKRRRKVFTTMKDLEVVQAIIDKVGYTASATCFFGEEKPSPKDVIFSEMKVDEEQFRKINRLLKDAGYELFWHNQNLSPVEWDDGE